MTLSSEPTQPQGLLSPCSRRVPGLGCQVGPAAPHPAPPRSQPKNRQEGRGGDPAWPRGGFLVGDQYCHPPPSCKALKDPACLSWVAQTPTRKGRGRGRASPPPSPGREGHRGPGNAGTDPGRDSTSAWTRLFPGAPFPGRDRAAGGGHAPCPGRTCVAASAPRPGYAGGRLGRATGPPRNGTWRT